MSKGLKIVLAVSALLIAGIISIPFLFKDNVIALLKETVNNNLNARVEFTDADLSLFRSFPDASVRLNNVSVTNFEPFKGDTLFSGKQIDLNLKLTQLFKKTKDGLHIKSFSIDNAFVNVLVDENGNANYDIAKKTTQKQLETNKSDSPSNFSLKLNNYAITNSHIQYTDTKGKTRVELTDFNHSGTGDFSQKKTDLTTKTTTSISFFKDKTAYADKQHLDLEAVLALDLENKTYSFLKNEAHINHLPLIFDGFVKVNDANQEVHVNFKTPSSDFKNFLALIPEKYAKNISDVKTTGDFSVIGTIEGIVDSTHIPKLDIAIASNNASFKYPSLPKGVNNIHIQAQLKNTTGNVKNTYVNIDKLAFKIDENSFKGKGTIKNLTTNPYINTTVNGTVDLAHVDKVYPVNLKNKLSGVITANVNSSFDIDAIKNNTYQRIKNNGKIQLQNFVYDSKEVANPIKINTAKVDFQPAKVSLNTFDATTGTSDLKATGTLKNLLGFLLSDKKLQGNFNLNSNVFKISDFMTKTEENTGAKNKTSAPSQKEALKIPSFLDCAVAVNAKKVYYDNLTLQNVTGSLILQDEKATLKKVNGTMFGGSIALNGAVNTQKKPVFDMNLGIKSFDISESFQKMQLFQTLTPIASALQGKLNTNINLSGSLNDDFTPNITSATGKALAEVLNTKVNPEKSKALNLLSNQLKFVDFDKLNLKNLKTTFTFKGGKVFVKPFNVKYKDIDINIGGNHGFDKTINYDVTFNVPAKYMGAEATKLLAKLGASDQNMKVPVTATIGGSYTNPSVKTNMKAAVTNLTTQLLKKQKDKLLDKAVGGLFGKPKDSAKAAKQDNTVKAVKNIFNGLFGKKKK